MHNVITARTCTRFGIAPTTVRNALQCCLRQLNHGIYVGITRCPRHPELEMFLDDEEILAIRGAGAHCATRADIDRVRRSEFLAAISAYSHYADGDVLALTAAAVLHEIPLIGSTRVYGPRSRRRSEDQQEPVSMLSLGEPGSRVHLDVWNPVRPYRSTWITRRMSEVDLVDVAEVNGRAVTTAVRTCVDLARAGTAFDGTVAMDHILARALTGGGDVALERVKQELRACVERADRTPGVRRARIAVSTATGRAESVAESIALQWFQVLGIRHVQQQVEIMGEMNEFIGRVDFLLTADDGTPVVVEVDGAVKYRAPFPGLVRSAAQGSQSQGAVHGGDAGSIPTGSGSNPLFREKQREDRIRRESYRVVRLTWKDLMSDMAMMMRLRDAGIDVR
ncbi:MAG TPA: PD-(D/E)XK nuclease family protein [Candidatus Brevibacterium intestinigallinarum]|nr:PD-(D/E)XK nuclease family protein [Candidatus Brevibacterium intestinigallinarum]